jgi:hypothetical protein
MPGTVSEVSATLVASTSRRPRDGANTRCCSGTESRANSGRIFDRRGVGPVRETLGQQRGRLAYLALARKKHEDVAGTLSPEVLDRVDDRVLELLLVVRLGVARGERPVPHFDRVHAAGHFDDRGGRSPAAEVPREAVGIQRRRRDDHFEIGPPGEEPFEVSRAGNRC